MDKEGLNLHQVSEQCSLNRMIILEHITDDRLMASKNSEGQYIIKNFKSPGLITDFPIVWPHLSA
jgi:hypothetical protein